MLPPFVVCRGCPGSDPPDSSRGRRNRQPQLKGSAAVRVLLSPDFVGNPGTRSRDCG